MTATPPKMPLSSTVVAMKAEAAASLSRGLAAASAFIVVSVLSVCEALQLRKKPASTANTVEAGNITQMGRA